MTLQQYHDELHEILLSEIEAATAVKASDVEHFASMVQVLDYLCKHTKKGSYLSEHD